MSHISYTSQTQVRLQLRSFGPITEHVPKAQMCQLQASCKGTRGVSLLTCCAGGTVRLPISSSQLCPWGEDAFPGATLIDPKFHFPGQVL